jgi:hypothetical protein
MAAFGFMMMVLLWRALGSANVTADSIAGASAPI